MNIDEVITLEDDSNYLLLIDSLCEGSRYFLAVKLENNNPTDEYVILKEVLDGAEISVELIDNEALLEQLIVDFENQTTIADETEMNNN